MRSFFKIIFTVCCCFLFSFLKAQTFSGAGGAIPDNNTQTCFPVMVTGVGNINTTTLGLAGVCINIAHTYDADLDIWLRAPDGTMIELSTDNGGSSPDYSNTCFNESASTNITAGSAPFASSFTPEGTMGSVNNGQNANGTWYLCITDDSGGNTGTLNGFTITFSSTPATSVLPACSGNTPAGNTCAQATPICNFNGYCGNTSSTYTVDTWPELTNAFDFNCSGATIENNSFIQFVASASTVTLNVWVYHSTFGYGIQMMVYGGGCGSGAVTTYGCVNPMLPSSNAQPVTATGLTPGNTYYLMIDGYAGDICDYTIGAVSGINVLNVSTPTATAVTSTTICNGGSVALTVSGGAGPYTWSPATGLSATTGTTVTASPAAGTTYTVSSTPVGSCPGTTQITVNIAAAPAGPTVTSPVTYCRNATASPLSATGTNVLYYNVPGGGTGVASLTPSTTTAGTFTYYATQNPAGCESVRVPITVNITANSTITLSSVAGTNAQTICRNTAITNITYATANGVTGATITGLPAGVTGAYGGGTNGTFTISGSPTTTTGSPFSYTITTSGGCGTATISGTLTVQNPATLTRTSAAATTSQTVCINGAITSITYNFGGSATGATVSGLPAGITGTYAGGVVTISGAPTTNAGSPFSYSVSTTGGCNTVTLSGTVTVSPNATITLTSGAGTNAQSVCVNSAISSITYSTAGGVTGVSFGGLPAGVTGSYSGGTNGTVTISGSPTTTAGSPFNYTITKTGGCGTASVSGTITANPIATLTRTSAAATTTQTVCINGSITNITYSVGGSATGATVSGLPTGVTGTYAAGVVTISGSPTTTIGSPFSYTVTTTGGSCGTPSLSGTITVNPVATLSLASGSNTQAVCINTGISTITYNVGGSATSATVSGLPTGVTGTYGAGVVTISGAPTTTVGSPFSYTVTTTGGSCGTPSLSGTITVNPVATLSLASGSNTQAVCINTGISTITYNVGGSATGATVSGLPTGVTGTYAAGVVTINGTPTTTVGSPFTYTVTTTGGSCGNPSLTGTITVNPVATLTLASGSNVQAVCINAGISTITYNVGGSATGATVTGLPTGVTGTYAAGVVTINGTPTTTLGSPFSYTVTTTGGSCGTPSLTGTITVNPVATLTLASGSNTQAVCINTGISTITYNVSGSATGATVTGLPTGVTGTYSAGVVTISGMPTTTIGSPFNYTVTTTGGSCGTPSLSGTITVNPVATLTLASGSNAQAVCINTGISTITYNVGGSATGATVSGLPTGVTGNYAAGVVTINGTPTTTAGSPFTYTVTTTGGSCGTPSLSGTITVNPVATLTLASGSNAQAVCFNTGISTITYNVGGSATGATVTGLPTGVSGTYAAGIVTINGTPTTTVGSPFNYTVTTTGGCSFATLSGTITVNPVATLTLASGSNAQAVCINTGISTITYNVGGSATGATVSGLPTGVTGTYAAGVVTISGTPTTTVGSPFNYTVTTIGGSCGTPSLNGTITVNPVATLTLASGSNVQAVCINTGISTITYNVGGSATGATVSGLPTGVSGSYAAGVFTINGTPTTTVGSPFTYTVTTTGGNCGTPSLSGTITVNPVATLTPASGSNTQAVCINTAISTITYNVGGSATGATVSGLPTGVTGTYAAGAVTISGTPTTTVGSPFNYTVTTTGGCSSATLGGTITVNPVATLTLASGSNAQAVCITTGISTITYNVGGSATGATVSGLPAGVTGTYAAGVVTINGTPTTTLGSPFSYTVTTTGGSCGTPSLSGTITVNPTATLTLASGSNTQAVCINTGISTITYNVGGSGTGATVTGLPTGVTGTYAAGVVTISGTPTITVGSPFTYTVTTTGGCSSATLGGTLTVNPTATLTLASGSNAQAVCINIGISTITYNVGGSATGATVTGLPTGVTANYSAGVVTISGTPTTTVGSPFSYTVTTTGGSCGTPSLSGTITVNPAAAITLASGSNTQAVCINTGISTITYNVGGSATGATVSGLPTGVTGTYAAGVVTINGTPTTTFGSPFSYTVTTTGGSCGTPSLSGTITVNPVATLTLAAGSNVQATCINTSISTITYNVGGSATGATVSGLPTGVTGTYSAGVVIINGTPTTTVGSPFNYIVTTTGGCLSATLGGTITVNPDMTITLNSPAGSNAQTVCVNSAINTISYITANGVTGAAFSGLPSGVSGTYSGGTNGAITLSGIPNSTTGSPFNYSITTTGGCGTATVAGSITVNAGTTIALNTAGTNTQTVCINTPINAIVYQTTNGATGVSVTGLPAGVTGSYSGGTNGTFTINGSPNLSTGSPFAFTVTATGGCGTPSLSGSISVTPNATLTLNTAGSNTQTVCVNTAINNIVYQTANGVTGVSAAGLPTGVTGVYSGGTNGTFTISGSPNNISGSPFSYTVSTTGGCSSATLSGSITVNLDVTLTLNTAGTNTLTVCINSPINPITYNTTNGVTGVTATGLPAGITGNYSGGTNGTFTISGSPLTATGSPFIYNIITTGGCDVANASGTVTVNPNAAITLSSVASTAMQTVCINTAINPIQYVISNGATGVNVSGLPAGVTGTLSGNTFTINGSPTVSAASAYNYTVITTGGCSSQSLSGSITVTAAVTIGLTSAAGTNAQTTCINSLITPISYTLSNGATGATVTGLPAGVTGTYISGIFTISGTPITNGIFNYIVTTSGGCNVVTASGTITVNSNVAITLTSAAATTNQTICPNTGILNITYSTSNGVTGITSTGLPAGITATYSGGTNGTVTISGTTPPASGVYNYSITTTGGCSAASSGGSITVSTVITLSLTSGPDAQVTCFNIAVSPVVYTITGATGAIVTGLPAGVTGIYSGGVLTISGVPTVSSSTTPFNYTVTTTGGGCGTLSLTGTIIVKPLSGLTLTSGSNTQTVCAGTAISNINYSTTNGVTNAVITGLPAGVTGIYSGGTNGTIQISGAPTTAVGSPFNYTITTNGGCGIVTLNGTITVNPQSPDPVVTAIVNYCPGAIAHPLNQDITTGINLQYYATQFGGTGSSTTPVPSTAVAGSSTPYWVSQTIPGSCESNRVLITVNVSNPLTITIGADANICQGDTARFTPTVTPAADSYQWTATGGNNNTITAPSSLNTGMFPATTTQYTLSATLSGCTIQQSVMVNVRLKPIIDAGNNITVCFADSVLLTAAVTHTSGTNITYSWTPANELNTPNTLQTWAHPAGTKWYRITATTTAADYGCDFSVSDSVKVFVQPKVHAFAGNDTIAAKDLPHQLHGTGGLNYLWSSPTAVFSNAIIANPTTVLHNDANIFLQVKDALGCTGYDSVFIKVYAGPAYYVPTAFSPDGDGLNDVFRAIPAGISNTIYFRVFNRYGQLVFETSQYLKGWDGTMNGTKSPQGTYVWMLKGVDKYNKPIELKGTVLLIR